MVPCTFGAHFASRVLLRPGGLSRSETGESVLADNYLGDRGYAWSKPLKINSSGPSAKVIGSEIRQYFSNYVEHTKLHVWIIFN